MSSLNDVCNELFVFVFVLFVVPFELGFKLLFLILISTSISLPFNSFNFSSTFFKAIACSFSNFCSINHQIDKYSNRIEKLK